MALFSMPHGRRIPLLNVKDWCVDPLNGFLKKLKKANFVTEDSRFFNFLESLHELFLSRLTDNREITSEHVAFAPLAFHLLVFFFIQGFLKGYTHAVM